MQTVSLESIEKASDEKLIELLLSSGDQAYFEVIYERYALRVYQKCISFTKNEEEAKDLAHDIFIKIYLKSCSFKGKSKLSTWIYSIAYNHCVDYQAKKSKQMTLREEIQMDMENEVIEAPSDQEIMEIDIDILKDLLEQLSPSEKSILLMKYQDGFSIKEIMEMVGSGESAVKMKLKRTKAKLLSLYEASKKR